MLSSQCFYIDVHKIVRLAREISKFVWGLCLVASLEYSLNLYFFFLFNKIWDAPLSFSYLDCSLWSRLLGGEVRRPCSLTEYQTFWHSLCHRKMSCPFSIVMHAWPCSVFSHFPTPPHSCLLLFSGRLGELKPLLVVNNSQNPHMYLQISEQTRAEGKRKEGQRTLWSPTSLSPRLVLLYSCVNTKFDSNT